MSNIIRPITDFEPDKQSEVAAGEIHDNYKKFLEGHVREGADAPTFCAYFPINIGNPKINLFHTLTEEKFLSGIGLDVDYIKEVEPGFVITPEGTRIDIERQFDECGVLYGILYQAISK